MAAAHRGARRALALALAGAVGCSGDADKPTTPSTGGRTPGCATALLWVDADLDGFGDAAQPEEACVNTPGHAAVSGDCDDTDGSVNPGAAEVCNGVDDDCDGSVDRGLLIDVWTDADGDGYGDPDTFAQVCTAEADHVRDASDCDDTDAAIHPDGVEVCDGADQDCNGRIDDDAIDQVLLYTDADADGLGDPADGFLACPETAGTADNPWDCDDADPTLPVVVGGGDDTAAGTVSEPLATIQAGVDLAQGVGGAACVAVLPGLYNEALDLSAGEVWVYGVEGADSTVVDGFGLEGPVLTLGEGNQASTLVEGLTLTQGTAHRRTIATSVVGQRYDYVLDQGAGVYARGARATLRGVEIRDNAIIDPELVDYTDTDGRPVRVTWSGEGGGVYVEGGILRLERCVVADNEAPVGGGLYASEAVAVEQTAFLQNIATKAGGAVYLSEATATAENLVFAGNVAPNGPSVWADDSATIFSQLTVHEDVPTSIDGALMVVDGGRGLWANLIVSAVADVGLEARGSETDLSVDGVLFHQVATPFETSPFGPLRVVGDLLGDPLFVGISEDLNPANDDLHLAPDSPAVDAGRSGRDADGTDADLGAYGGLLGAW